MLMYPFIFVSIDLFRHNLNACENKTHVYQCMSESAGLSQYINRHSLFIFCFTLIHLTLDFTKCNRWRFYLYLTMDLSHTHTHTHTCTRTHIYAYVRVYIYMYIYIYMCVCVCVCEYRYTSSYIVSSKVVLDYTSKIYGKIGSGLSHFIRLNVSSPQMLKS